MRLVKDDQVVVTSNAREAAQLKASGFREAKPEPKKAEEAPAEKPAKKTSKSK